MNELMQVGAALESGMMTAAEMTHALCDIGGGSMGTGIQAIFDSGFDSGLQEGFYTGFSRGLEEGKKQNEIKTAITCAACVAGGVAMTGLIVWCVKKYKAKERDVAEKNCKQTERNQV